MGKAIVLVVVAVILGASYLMFGAQQTAIATDEKQNSYSEKVLSREIALSAYNMAVSRITRDYESWRQSYTNKAYQNGYYDLSATGGASGPVEVTSEGRFGAAKYILSGTLVRSSLLEAFIVDAEEATVTAVGPGFTISGNDTNPPSLGGGPGSGPSVHGILVTRPSVYTEFGGTMPASQVKGVVGNGDIIMDDPQIPLETIIDEAVANTTHEFAGHVIWDETTSIGTDENPVVVHARKDVTMSDNSTGYGLLYVEGSLTMEDNACWEGLVIVESSKKVKLSGTAAIYGSLLMDGKPVIPFIVDGLSTVPLVDYKVHIEVLGAAITYGGQYDIPVTVQLLMGTTVEQPWGSYMKAVDGNVNQEGPFVFHPETIYEAGTSIRIDAQSWIKKKSYYSGDQNNHWKVYIEQNSRARDPNLVVLRDGSDVPDLEGMDGQDSAGEIVGDYIGEDGTMVLEESQTIYLFELGTDDPNSSAWDMQDLVILVTLIPLVPEESEGGESGDLVASIDFEIDGNAGVYYSVSALMRLPDLLGMAEDIIHIIETNQKDVSTDLNGKLITE